MSCSDDEPTIEQSVSDLSAEQLFESGKVNLSNKKYRTAIDDFQEIERLYPFSRLSNKGQTMAAYAMYKNEQYGDALDQIDRFIRQNPGHEDISYMYYLRALTYYDQIADIKRDQANTRSALTSLDEVVQRFPNTDYARDAKIKRDLVVDHLAGKQMEIGRFYLKQQKFVAAINRFQKVVKTFDTTSHVEEALYRLVEANLSLGLVGEAKRNAAVLGHNYPNSKWYDYAYRLAELGEDAPVPTDPDSGWFGGWFGGEEESTDTALPTDNLADSWFDFGWF